MDIDDPILGSNNPDQLADENERGTDGFFPIGSNGFWHGGVHLRTPKPIVAIRDGQLVAYRIDERPHTVELEGGQECEFSTGFALIKHETATPLGHKIEFYSLSMHLLHWDAYVDDPTLETPVFLRARRPEKVKTKASGKGLRLAGDAGPASSVGVVPKDGKIVVTGDAPPDDHWAKARPRVVKVRWGALEGWLELGNTTTPERGCTRYFSTAKITVLSSDDPSTIAGEIPANHFFELGTSRPAANAWKRDRNRTRVRQVKFGEVTGFAIVDRTAAAAEQRVTVERDDPGADKLGVTVRAEPNAKSPVVAILPKGTSVRFKDPLAVSFRRTTTYHEILEGGFVPVDKTTLEEDNSLGDHGDFKVVVPRKPFRISRGDLLGWAGIGLRRLPVPAGAPAIGAENMIHFEVFAESDALLANPHNEHWFNATYRLPVGMKLKKSELLPAAQNPSIAVDLPVRSQVRISERFHGSGHVKTFRHEVIGWRRISELGEFHAGGLYRLGKGIATVCTNHPATCWCDEAALVKATFGARPDDYVVRRDLHDVPETFQLVSYEKPGAARPTTIKGWAREHDLGDFYAEAHRPAAAVQIAVAAKPTNWIAPLAAPKIAVGASTWVRRDAKEAVSQTFRKIKHAKNEGWVPKERLGPADPATKIAKLLGEANLLEAPPTNLEDLRTKPALATLAVDAEVTDLGVDRSQSEPWIHIAFRDSAGAVVTAWARESELGAILKDRYVLRAGLSHLSKYKPKNLDDFQNRRNHLPIGASAGEALERKNVRHVAKERWAKVQIEGGSAIGWLRQVDLDDAANKTRYHHYILADDLDFVLPAEPAQVQINGAAGAVLQVLGEATSAGVVYQHVKLGRKSGWWPKAELGNESGGNRELTEALSHVLRDAPHDPPERVRVRALEDDVVQRLAVKGAYAKIRVVVTFEADRCHGFLPAADLVETVPAGSAAFQRKYKLRRARTSVLTYDPEATYVFEADAGQVPAERGDVAGKYEFTRMDWSLLRHDKNGHLWTEVAGQGWVNLHLDTISRAFAEPKLTGASSYDWASTWMKYEETEEAFNKDGFCDVASLVDLIEKDVSGRPRTGGALDHVVTVPEIKEALRQPAVVERLRHAACRHPSEWDAASDDKWKRLKDEPWKMDDHLFDAHMDMIKKEQLWTAVAGLPSSTVWHFHPLGFVKQLREMKGVTADQLKQIYGRSARTSDIEKYIPYLNEAMERYEIDTPLLQAHFLAQLGHESAFLSSAEEGQWAGHAPGPNVGEDYEWRFDLDNIRQGDGKRFKGRGLMQLTGRANYSLYSAYIGRDLTVDPSPLATDPRLACDVSAWFWRRGATRDLNTVATSDTYEAVHAVSSYINMGGIRPGKDPNGLAQRVELFNNAKRVLID